MTCFEIITASIQTLGTLVTGYLAIRVYKDGKKIKNLTDVVNELVDSNKELKVQNGILAKQLRLFSISTIRDRIPFFRAAKYPPKSNGREFTLNFINKGANAQKIKVENKNPEFGEISCGTPSCPRDNLIIIIGHSTTGFPLNQPINFIIHFENEFGDKSYQVVKFVIDQMPEISNPDE